MNYLKYIEHAAENLQFWLWFRDYAKRFSELPSNESCLAPEWRVDQAETESAANQNPPTGSKNLGSEAAAVFAGTDFAPPKPRERNPFGTPPRTPADSQRDLHESNGATEADISDDDSTTRSAHHTFHTKAASAFEKAELKWQPCNAASAAWSIRR
jgi:hypothetical protein